MNKTMLIQILLSTIFIYVFFGIFLYLRQGSIVYYPDDQDFNSCSSFTDYQKLNSNGTRFYFLEQSKDLIVFYHGNAGSTCNRSFLKKLFEPSGKSIIFVEYAGYSNDQQAPTKKLILQDVVNIKNFVGQKKFNNITVIGSSVGSGAASYHTYIDQVDNLLLLSSFSKMSRIAQSLYPIYPTSLLLKENYDNIKWLKNYNNDILLIHGINDQVIPIRFGQELYDSLSNQNKEFMAIPDTGHNNLLTRPEVTDKISEFIK